MLARPAAVLGSGVLAGLAALHLLAAIGFVAVVPGPPAWAGLAFGLVVVVSTTSLSILVARRAEGAVVGVLLGLLSLSIAHVVAKESWLRWVGELEDPQRWAWVVALTAEDAWWVLVTFALLVLHFPDGRLPSRRWRRVPAALVVSGLVVQVDGAVAAEPFRSPLAALDRPFGPWPVWWQALGMVAFAVLLLLAVASTVSLFLRHRRATTVQRRQITWLALAGVGLPLYPLTCLLEIAWWGHVTWFSGALGMVSLAATPVAVGIAVLRHDLYDVDKALALALTWWLVTAVLLSVYTAVSSFVGLLAGRGSEAGVALGTAAASLLLLPAFRVVRRAVDARTYPLRRAALSAVDGLHREVSAGRARPEQLEERLRLALRDPDLRVGFRAPGSQAFCDVAGDAVPGTGALVVQDGEHTGVVCGGCGPASAELLRDVADRCSTLVELVRLRAEVDQALREVRSSRTRLVEIGYEERRKMERDLHDGAQQRLVALGMQLRLAQRHLADGTVDLDDLLDGSVAELATAVSELRHIAHGLRPSNLDDGLPAALSKLVRSLPMTVDLDVHDGALPDAVATTAYFIASEAIANAVKHADATRIELRVERRDGQLLVRVRDDGRGGAELGLRSGLSDRVAALGGQLRVASPVGDGTEVEAALPCAS